MMNLRWLNFGFLLTVLGMSAVFFTNITWKSYMYEKLSVTQLSVGESKDSTAFSLGMTDFNTTLPDRIRQNVLLHSQSGPDVRVFTVDQKGTTSLPNYEHLQEIGKTQKNQEHPSVIATLSLFRQNFLLWNSAARNIAETTAPQSSNNDSKYLIYKCDQEAMQACGGITDRLKGMMAAYIIASITDRQFKVYSLSLGCDISQYLMPNLVNWSLPLSFRTSPDTVAADIKIVNKMNSKEFYNSISNMNFTELVGYSKYVYFKANLDYSQGFQQSQIYKDHLSWMKLLTPDQIQSTIFKHLFTLSPRLQLKLQNLLAVQLPTVKHKLICAHVRMGKNPSIPHDYPVRLSFDSLPTVWKFIKEHSRTEFHKVFVMTDSEDALKEAKQQEFSSRLIVTPGRIGHIDIPGSQKKEEICGVTDKVILDFHLLMNCDVLLVTKSGLSRLAAYVRGSDNELYCLVNGTSVIKCMMQQLKDMHDALGK